MHYMHAMPECVGLFKLLFSKRERRDAGKPSKSDNFRQPECSASFAPGHVHVRRARRTYLFAARGAHAKRARIHRCEVRLHAIAGSGPRCELLLHVCYLGRFDSHRLMALILARVSVNRGRGVNDAATRRCAT